MQQTPLRFPRALALLASGWLASGCGGQASSSAPAPVSGSAPRDVRVVTLTPELGERTLFATGELEPDERVTLATKVPGRLASIGVERGQRVRAGETLARLESREFELRVAQAGAALAVARAALGLPAEGPSDEVVAAETATVRLAEAELARARLEHERAGALAREGVDSQAMLDRAATTLRAAESRLQEAHEVVAARRATLAQRRAELEIARAQLSETSLEAPFDGVVVERQAAPGAYLAVGASVCELVRIDPLRLVLQLPAGEAERVTAGAVARVRVAGTETVLIGTVAHLAPVLANASRTRALEALFPNPEARALAGSFVEAELVLEPATEVLVVPASAVRSFAGLDKLCFVRDGKLEERRVTLGARRGERVELLAGAAPGELLVLEPGDLQNGVPVRAVP